MRRASFDIYVSQFVLDEAAAGDTAAGRERLAVLEGLPVLDLTEEVIDLAEALKTSLALPKKAVTDAAHIAIAAVHGMHPYLVGTDYKQLVGISQSAQQLITHSPGRKGARRVNSW